MSIILPEKAKQATRVEAPARRPVFTASGRLSSWRGIDLVTAAMLAVASGVVFWVFDTFVYPVLGIVTIGFPPLGELALGVWLIPAIVSALVIRRPGAAILTELIAANVELLLGNQWGVTVLLSGMLQGVGVEVIFGIMLWRRFGPVTAIVGGLLSAVLEIGMYEWWAYVPGYSWMWRFVYLGSGMLSGAIISGFGGWVLVRALTKAGALDAFPVGNEFL